MTEPKCVQTLVALGLTALEGEVYTLLLRESPATGYRVAQALGKPARQYLTYRGRFQEIGTARGRGLGKDG